MEVGAVELLLVRWFCVFEFVNILLNYRGSQARYERYDEAGITSSIWFSDAVGGGAARRSPYRDHRGGLGATDWRCAFKWAGPGAAPEDIGGIVAADLRNSGKFNPLDRSDCRSSQPPLRKFSLPHGLRWVLMPSSLDRSRRIRTVPTMLLISWLTLAARRVPYWRKTLIK